METNSFLRPSVAEKSGYSAQHDPADIVLDANESPYSMPDELQEHLQKRLESIAFNRYPDSRSETLRQFAADYYGVSPDRIVAGNGSDELIGYVLLACLSPGETVLTVEPSFSMYRILANQHHAEVRTVELSSDWSLPGQLVDQARSSKIVFVGSPNNPTGNQFRPEKILELVEETDALVVLDEAYAEFSDRSLVPELENYRSLVILRTLSKAFGLASARVGFLLGFRSIVDGINTVRLPYNLNSLSQAAGEVVLSSVETFHERWETIIEERDLLHSFLEENGFRPCASDANFILFKPDDSMRLYTHLLEDGIRVRKFSEESIADYLRVTVGTPEQNRAFRESLKRYN